MNNCEELLQTIKSLYENYENKHNDTSVKKIITKNFYR